MVGYGQERLLHNGRHVWDVLLWHNGRHVRDVLGWQLRRLWFGLDLQWVVRDVLCNWNGRCYHVGTL